MNIISAYRLTENISHSCIDQAYVGIYFLFLEDIFGVSNHSSVYAKEERNIEEEVNVRGVEFDMQVVERVCLSILYVFVSILTFKPFTYKHCRRPPNTTSNFDLLKIASPSISIDSCELVCL